MNPNANTKIVYVLQCRYLETPSKQYVEKNNTGNYTANIFNAQMFNTAEDAKINRVGAGMVKKERIQEVAITVEFKGEME